MSVARVAGTSSGSACPRWTTTVSNAAWDFLPRDDRDRVVYVTEGDGDKIRLLRTPPLTAVDNRYEQTTHLTILPDGTSVCRRSAT